MLGGSWREDFVRVGEWGCDSRGRQGKGDGDQFHLGQRVHRAAECGSGSGSCEDARLDHLERAEHCHRILPRQALEGDRNRIREDGKLPLTGAVEPSARTEPGAGTEREVAEQHGGTLTLTLCYGELYPLAGRAHGDKGERAMAAAREHRAENGHACACHGEEE